ncbi:MAG: metallophosphoesterase [Polyangiaceae bacterium]
MNVQILSDLHFEFHADGGRSFVADLDPTGTDVLVLAGDIAVGDGIAPALDLFAARYSRAEIVYVHGNHEYYGTTREAAVEVTRGACARHANLHWLEQQTIELRGTRFVGATLWFPYDERVHPLRGMLNDFHKIEGFEAWNYEANASAARFLEREVRPGDVVVTHHLPVRASVAEQYKDDPFNAFFLSDVEPILHAKRPRLWIHGHTHASVDVVVGDTRVVCNPFGYVRHELNAAFRADLRVALDRD